MDKSGILHGVKDRFHGIVYRKNETGRKLTEFFSGVHQGRGVRQKVQVCHHGIKFFFNCGRIGRFIIPGFRCRYCSGYTTEELRRRFDNLSFLVFLEITPFKDTECVFGYFKAVRRLRWYFRPGNLFCHRFYLLFLGDGCFFWLFLVHYRCFLIYI